MKQKMILSLLAITPISGSLLPLIINNHPQNENKINLKTNNNSIINPETGKVNYVTLGDSLSAGFTALSNKQYNYINYQATDHSSTTHQIYGDAYSAWVARALQKENLLGSYDNFAIASQTTGQIIHQIDHSYPQNADDQEHYNTFTDNGKFDAWISKSDWNNYYNNSTVVTKAIKNADFINLTLGGNDIIYLCKLFGISTKDLKNITPAVILEAIKNLYSSGFDINKAITYNNKDFNDAVLHLKNNISYLVNLIHRINPHAKVMLLGYFFPLAQIRSLLDLSQPVPGSSIIENIIDVLNSSIKRIANNYSFVDYVANDSYVKHISNQLHIDVTTPKNKHLVINNYNAAAWYTPIFQDIHPGPYGYRDMAGNILSALVGSNQNNINPDPNLPLNDNTITRLIFNNRLENNINDLQNINAPLKNFTVSKTNARSIAYLQPEISLLDKTTIEPSISIKSSITNTLINHSLSTFNNNFYSFKLKINKFANAAINVNDRVNVIAFKRKWNNVAARNVGITELQEYAHLII